MLPGEVHLIDLPGRPRVVLTRQEAIDLTAELCAGLSVAEPYIPRLSLFRRAWDVCRAWWNRRDIRASDEVLRQRAKQLLNAGMR